MQNLIAATDAIFSKGNNLFFLWPGTLEAIEINNSLRESCNII